MITAVVDRENIQGDVVEIKDKKDINHLINSFRLKEGSSLRVVDGVYEYQTIIESISKKLIVCEIKEKLEDSYSREIKISAGIGVLKNDKMELTIQKLAEIGIDQLIPLKLSRSVAKVKSKKDKWDVVAREALKQCQGVKLMEITEPKGLKEIDYAEYDLVLVPYENEEDIRIREILDFEEDIKSILYIIGSEGGISEEEVDYLKSNGAKIVSLGKRILRAETAAIVVGGILTNEV